MMEMAFAPEMARAGAVADGAAESTLATSTITVRKDFPETWIWDIQKTSVKKISVVLSGW